MIRVRLSRAGIAHKEQQFSDYKEKKELDYTLTVEI